MRGRRALLSYAIAGAVLLSAAPTVASAAPPSEKNRNAGTVELDCDGTDVEIWVNFVASDRSGESPALTTSANHGRVFKIISYTFGDETFEVRFPAPEPPFERVTCTHPYGDDTVTLVGVFIG